jgi:hypothetical protein
MMQDGCQICSAHDQNHEKAQMFHLHVGLNWLKDPKAGMICQRGAAFGVLRVAN